MFKIITLFFIIFALSACSGGEQKRELTNNFQAQKNKIIDFKEPQERADIVGVVESIIGNKVKILKIDRMSNMDKSSEENNEENSKNQESKAKAIGVNNMRMPGRIPGGGMKRNSEGDSVSRVEKLKSLSTGTETVIIPVGIKIFQKEAGEVSLASLSDIKRDQMIRVWLSDGELDKNVEEYKRANFAIIN